jgi:hypothetical protein
MEGEINEEGDGDKKDHLEAHEFLMEILSEVAFKGKTFILIARLMGARDQGFPCSVSVIPF